MSDKFVLLVEDNADDEELAIIAFQQAKILNDVVVARDGEEALEYLFRRASHEGGGRLPQVIMLDLKLPKLGGLQVLDSLRANPPTARIPVVVMTSSDEEADVEASYRLGANSYVCKPVGFQAFVDAVQKVGSYWLFSNRT